MWLSWQESYTSDRSNRCGQKHNCTMLKIRLYQFSDCEMLKSGLSLTIFPVFLIPFQTSDKIKKRKAKDRSQRKTEKAVRNFVAFVLTCGSASKDICFRLRGMKEGDGLQWKIIFNMGNCVMYAHPIVNKKKLIINPLNFSENS